MGKTFVTGDFNSRCGNREDFITNDVLSNENIDLLEPLLHYTSDDQITPRRSADLYVNNFGRKSIAFCRTTGLRIVNGRHKDDIYGSITFCSSNGMSLIDYLLCDFNLMSDIKTFTSGIFNTFSDHAPIIFKLHTDIFTAKENQVRSDSIIRCPSTTVKWMEENKEIILNNLSNN